jgi:A/G-specific adenine glycosylase
MRKLVSWGTRNMRHFPWRTRRTPYRVLIAEKLLQQTAARPAVVEAYERLIAYCSSPARLASADIRKLEKLVRPLGFVYRAKELKRLGKALNVRHKGRVPSDLRLLLELPGVGEYAARAVLSFAFGQPVPIVDTNIARFLHRFFALNLPLSSNPARSKALLNLAAKLMPTQDFVEFNFGLLDLCAGICVPRNPRCQVCPLRLDCFTGQRLGSSIRGQ